MPLLFFVLLFTIVYNVYLERCDSNVEYSRRYITRQRLDRITNPPPKIHCYTYYGYVVNTWYVVRSCDTYVICIGLVMCTRKGLYTNYTERCTPERYKIILCKRIQTAYETHRRNVQIQKYRTHFFCCIRNQRNLNSIGKVYACIRCITYAVVYSSVTHVHETSCVLIKE